MKNYKVIVIILISILVLCSCNSEEKERENRHDATMEKQEALYKKMVQEYSPVLVTEKAIANKFSYVF